MTNPNQQIVNTHQGNDEKKRRRINVTVLVLVGSLLIAGVIYFTVGLFVIQPIGAIPEGATILYWRHGTNLPFISSPDGLLLNKGQGVSLLGRVVVLGVVGKLLEKRKIIVLPYSRTLYLISTGGKEFEK